MAMVDGNYGYFGGSCWSWIIWLVIIWIFLSCFCGCGGGFI
jgi:hypothetical protein